MEKRLQEFYRQLEDTLIALNKVQGETRDPEGEKMLKDIILRFIAK